MKKELKLKPCINKNNGQVSIVIPKRKLGLKWKEKIPSEVKVKFKW